MVTFTIIIFRKLETGFSYNGYKDIEITLNGQHQIYNSIMAINVVE